MSTLAYRNAHHEDVDFDADPFADYPALEASPWLAHQVLPTLGFFRQLVPARLFGPLSALEGALSPHPPAVRVPLPRRPHAVVTVARNRSGAVRPSFAGRPTRCSSGI